MYYKYARTGTTTHESVPLDISSMFELKILLFYNISAEMQCCDLIDETRCDYLNTQENRFHYRRLCRSRKIILVKAERIRLGIPFVRLPIQLNGTCENKFTNFFEPRGGTRERRKILFFINPRARTDDVSHT